MDTPATRGPADPGAEPATLAAALLAAFAQAVHASDDPAALDALNRAQYLAGRIDASVRRRGHAEPDDITRLAQAMAALAAQAAADPPAGPGTDRGLEQARHRGDISLVAHAAAADAADAAELVRAWQRDAGPGKPGDAAVREAAAARLAALPATLAEASRRANHAALDGALAAIDEAHRVTAEAVAGSGHPHARNALDRLAQARTALAEAIATPATGPPGRAAPGRPHRPSRPRQAPGKPVGAAPKDGPH
ncbi:MAG: hypothetical protein ACYC0W_03480 [Candidatus Nanopelagicales bacterium]